MSDEASKGVIQPVSVPVGAPDRAERIAEADAVRTAASAAPVGGTMPGFRRTRLDVLEREPLPPGPWPRTPGPLNQQWGGS